MRQLTVEQLKDRRMSLNFIIDFKHEFGDSVTITEEFCSKVKDRFNWLFLADNYLSMKGFIEFYKIDNQLMYWYNTFFNSFNTKKLYSKKDKKLAMDHLDFVKNIIRAATFARLYNED